MINCSGQMNMKHCKELQFNVKNTTSLLCLLSMEASKHLIQTKHKLNKCHQTVFFFFVLGVFQGMNIAITSLCEKHSQSEKMSRLNQAQT